jgi:hypothetical protein
MLMTVWAEAVEANPRAASPAKRLILNFIGVERLVFSLLAEVPRDEDPSNRP